MVTAIAVGYIVFSLVFTFWFVCACILGTRSDKRLLYPSEFRNARRRQPQPVGSLSAQALILALARIVDRKPYSRGE
jgi:hypothetical protein